MNLSAQSIEQTHENAAATIAVALYYLQREALSTGLSNLAGLIDKAVQEASDQAKEH
ncbi:MAG: hypothetical protein QGF38_09095 [Rhodospirillales bacterium]|jgi:hypothetical protein|nr:hypothetical protein [Rhodospirillales bacterium]